MIFNNLLVCFLVSKLGRQAESNRVLDMVGYFVFTVNQIMEL